MSFFDRLFMACLHRRKEISMAARIIACVLMLISALCAITLAILVPLLRLPGIIWAAVMLANIARIILGNMIKNRYHW